MIKVRKKTYLQPAKVGEALNHTVWITIKIQGIMVSFFFFFLDQKTKIPKNTQKNLSVVQPMTIAPPDKHNTSLRVIV